MTGRLRHGGPLLPRVSFLLGELDRFASATRREAACLSAWLAVLLDVPFDSPPERAARADYQDAAASRDRALLAVCESVHALTSGLLAGSVHGASRGPVAGQGLEAPPGPFALLYLAWLQRELGRCAARVFLQQARFGAWLRLLSQGAGTPPEQAAREEYDVSADSCDEAVLTLREVLSCLARYLALGLQPGSA
jgi:hypothetical protein